MKNVQKLTSEKEAPGVLLDAKKKVNLVLCQKEKLQKWQDELLLPFEDLSGMPHRVFIYNMSDWDEADWLMLMEDPDFRNDQVQAEQYLLLCSYEDALEQNSYLSCLRHPVLLLDHMYMPKNWRRIWNMLLSDLEPEAIYLLPGAPEEM